MSLQITALYAALLGLLFILLSAQVSKYRLRGHVSMGDGNVAELGQAIRAHANFAEYVPLGLILIGLLEVQGASIVMVHALGAALLIGRILHAYGMSQPNAVHNARKLGIILTWLMILVASLALLFYVFR